MTRNTCHAKRWTRVNRGDRDDVACFDVYRTKANDDYSKYQEAMFGEESKVGDSKWSSPVLNHSDEPKGGSITDADLEKFPGWDRELVEQYLNQGWSIEQLAEYYQEEVRKHQNEA